MLSEIERVITDNASRGNRRITVGVQCETGGKVPVNPLDLMFEANWCGSSLV